MYSLINKESLNHNPHLHLSTSIRSFRSDKVSSFVKALLDIDVTSARNLLVQFKDKYPIFLTRNLKTARFWLRSRARGTERMGIIASSGAARLRPYGLTVKLKIDPRQWFLNGKEDVRSSYYLEDVATEFDIQGLELDWTVVAWDADLRYSNGRWDYMSFKGTKWQRVKDSVRQVYLKNAYRVLLTRARQGLIIFLPEGEDTDPTRAKRFYDSTYYYLKTVGIDEIT